MATTTTILALTKPATTDQALIGDINSNMDIIDSWAVASAGTNQAIADAAAAGTNAQFARSDHKHGMPNFGTPVSVTTANGNGVAATIARSDHAHKIADGAINANAMFAAGFIKRCQLTNSTDQTILGADPITFDTEVFDNDTMHSTGANTDRITATTAGVYFFIGSVTWANDAGGTIHGIYFEHNGTTDFGVFHQPNAVSSGSTQQTFGIRVLAAGEYVRMFATEDSLGVDIANQTLTAIWMGP